MPTSSCWTKRLTCQSNAAVQLFCFPYSGGSAQIFRSWPEKLNPLISAIAIELPGRGNRFREPLATKLDLMAKAISLEIQVILNQPCIFFGHSMGATLAFEVIRSLRQMGHAGPSHLIVSAQVAPHLNRMKRGLHFLPDSELISVLRDYNGTPQAVLENNELLPIFLPVLRADFSAIENFRYKPEPPLECPITAFAGTEDRHVPLDRIMAWQEQTTGGFNLNIFSGDHFFLRSQEDALLAEINSISAGVLEV